MKKILIFLLLAFPSCAGWASAQNFRCTVEASTATTLTAVGGDCAAKISLSHYITGVTAASSAAAGTSADSMFTLKYGSGGTCGTGTTIFWLALQEANTTVVDSLVTPIHIPQDKEICWIFSGAGTKTLVITGFLKP